MELNLILNSGEGIPIGNSLRQIALSRVKSWRPVAYHLNMPTNVLHTNSCILEDMMEFSCNLRGIVFTPKIEINDEYVVENYTFKEQLNSSDLDKLYFQVDDKSQRLLTALPLGANSPSNVETKILTVIYRLTNGDKTSADNRDFLLDRNVNIANYNIISSRHTDIEAFSFEVKTLNSSEEELQIKVASKGVTETEVINSSLNILASGLEKIKKAINSAT